MQFRSFYLVLFPIAQFRGYHAQPGVHTQALVPCVFGIVPLAFRPLYEGEWTVTIQVNSADAFEKLRVAIREHGLMGRVKAAEVMDPIIMEAAVRVGWQRLCEMTEFNRDSLFRLFDSTLKAVARGEG